MSDGLPPSMTDLLAPPAQPEESVLTEQPQRQVDFLTTGVTPPSDLYVSPMDSLRVELFSQDVGRPVQVKMRYVTPGGNIQYEEESLQTVALPASTVAAYPIGEAFLLSVAVVSAESSVQRGRVYASVSYIRAFGGPSAAFMHTLVQGYVTALERVSWPIIQADYPLNGQGLPYYIHLGSQPPLTAASYTVPAAVRARLLSMYFVLQTSATVATRNMQVQVYVGGIPYFFCQSPAAQPANTGWGYVCAPGLPSQQTPGALNYIPWPFNLILQGGATLSITIPGGQTGDQITDASLVLEEWIDM